MNPIPMLAGDLPALQRKTFIEESNPIRSKCRRPPWPSLPLLLSASVAWPRQARATRHLKASLAAQQVVNTAGLASTDSTDRTTPSNRVRAPAQRLQPSASFAISACSLVAFILVPNISRKFQWKFPELFHEKSGDFIVELLFYSFLHSFYSYALI